VCVFCFFLDNKTRSVVFQGDNRCGCVVLADDSLKGASEPV